MRLQTVLDRLQEQTVRFERVEIAMSDEPLTDLTDYPSLFIFPAAEEGGGDFEAADLGSGTYQTRTATFSLLIAAKVIGIDDIHDLRREAHSAIDGFTAELGYTPIVWQSGALVQMRGRVWWWQDFYSMSSADDGG